MFSEPVSGDKFFGRTEVLDLLNKRVMALRDGYRQNIALTGNSLSGKSSIITHFLHTIKEDGFVPVYVEVIKEPFRSFSNKFLATLIYNTLNALGEKVGIEMGELIDRAVKTLPKTSALIKGLNTHIERNEIDEAYSNLLALTSAVKEDTSLPCIVILDEFDNLEHLGVKNPFLNFGKVIMVQKDTMYIVSSSRDRAIKRIISEKLSLLFGNFEVVRVSNFDLDTSSSFVDTKLGPFDIEPKMKEFLIALTGGNPFYLDRITASSARYAEERMASCVDERDITEALLKLVYDANGVIHQYLLNCMLSLLDSKPREQQISMLVAIANKQSRQPDIARRLKVNRSETAKGLERLLEAGLVSKNGLFYRIDDTMLEFWLKHVYQRRKELLVNGTLDKGKLFREDIRSYITAYIEQSSRDYISRLADLFNLFSNDLVQIDAKQMRLPHFTKVELARFNDTAGFLSCSFRGNFWIIQPYAGCVTETDIISYIRNVKTLERKVVNKVIIPLKGIDENANLLAKELKISVWGLPTINMILDFYGKQKIIMLQECLTEGALER